MEFIETRLKGAFIVRIKRIEDARGFFGRAWCRDEFAKHGLDPNATQLNVGFSHKKGTLRGMHFQVAPHEEAKFVRCPRGAVHDVIVDLRADSPTRGQWVGVALNEDNAAMLYVPEGFATGSQRLEEYTEY